LFAEVAVRPFEEIPTAEWKRVMEVNIMGLALCCKAVAPQMRKQKSGRIINMGSTVTLTGVPFFAHYLATKGAVHAMTRGLARELGQDNITINTIAPGLTLSEGVLQHSAIRALHMNQHDEIVKRRAIARAQYPDDLVGTASFLASDDAAFITGQTIVVDGGTAML
jgi:NAD(P)-dependent dehydrogenase (short-subunit alcohol dehydrogenase family)